MTNKCLEPTTSSLTGTIARPSGRDGIIAMLVGIMVVLLQPPARLVSVPSGDYGGDAPAAGAVSIGAQQGVAAGAGLQPGEGTTPFTIQGGYFVATNGSDSNPGTISQPFRTIAKGVSMLTPGKTLLVRSGTYAESLQNTIPGGTSWSSPVTVEAYPGDTVTIQPSSGAFTRIVLRGCKQAIYHCTRFYN